MYYDKEFLKRLDENRSKTIYARIIALTLDEVTLESIEGRVTQGSINIDGDSAVRRTCSLTIAAQNFDYNAFIWGLNTKFKLEIGVENTIDLSYPNIIWFKQGTYFISQFNTSHSTNNFTISLQGKDKMCALNGELGGSLTSSVDFGTVEDIITVGTEKMTKITKLPVKDIIRNVVHLYGGEPLHNIIINDLDMSGLELLEYRYDENNPMYLYRSPTIKNFENITLDSNKLCYIKTELVDEPEPTPPESGDEPKSEPAPVADEPVAADPETPAPEGSEPDPEAPIEPTYIKLSDLTQDQLEPLITSFTTTKEPATIVIDGAEFYVAKVAYGETAGYRYTELTYPGDLIGAVGESLTSILDKIKNMLGDFEYFYNLDGQFIFQRKRYSFNSAWSPLSTNEYGQQVVDFDNNIAYSFSDSTLISAFNNNPDLNNLKNDYSVWGQRKSISGATIPVHMRYAIDRKPVYYKSIDKDKEGNDCIYTIADWDWREIIYQMAVDYYNHTNDDDFEVKVAAANTNYYPTGKTGYEHYYIDMISLWRDLYDPDKAHELYITLQTLNANLQSCEAAVTAANNALNLIPEGDEGRKAAEEALIAAQESVEVAKKNIINANNGCAYYPTEAEYQYWNKTVYEHPENLNFWFDFLDTEGALSAYSVKNIGCRPKSINDQNVKAIYFRETPEVIFTQNFEEDSKNSQAYTYISITEPLMKTMFSISSQGKSAKAMIDELLYKHSYCIATASITTVPIYYLEPNTKIHIVDQETKIDGYYNISKLSIPLSYNGTMSITATKAEETI